jgi:methyltransferase (TIGR00027 family)
MSKDYIRGPSVMAELAASHRAEESSKPVDERICYDQYAVHFLSPDALEIMKDPVKLKAFKEQVGPLAEGMGNSMRARASYFDDFIKQTVKQGIDQLVILGAGYDTRAYRIDELKAINVFEVDHPKTQSFKINKIKEIFSFLPENVVYVPVDFETQTLNPDLFEGYDRLKKTLFVMEGLIYYLTPDAVDKVLSFIAENSVKGSTILFDYFHQCVVDGTCEVGKIFKYYAEPVGETLKFGLKEETVEKFLSERGFLDVKNVTSEIYKKAYFQGINENREICSQVYFVHATVK